MEATKKSSNKAKAAGKDKIIIAFRKMVLNEGKHPSSVFAFCESIGIKESDFYQHFGSFDTIGNEIWNGYILEVAGRLELDKNYNEFSIREKLLAFYFTLAEVLREDRSFVLLTLKGWKNPVMPPKSLKGFKKTFESWLAPILNEGKQNGEIAMRPLLDTQYDGLFWLHLVFILQFWSNDDSAGFERTDAAIEKSVNLAFDLIGKGVLDNAIDFGKFLYQNAKN
ncbi:hypothetical protein BH09BAC3_BH09BAC3_30050 [soil metagenome]